MNLKLSMKKHVLYANRSMALDSLFLRPAMSLLKLLAYAILMAILVFVEWKLVFLLV